MDEVPDDAGGGGIAAEAEEKGAIEQGEAEEMNGGDEEEP